ncbi:MAG: hypothetical protein JXD22_03355 [Sedimentisphaerales bacterium]|nr:hypothetical protein [Sedimentisphaerales bacterium]
MKQILSLTIFCLGSFLLLPGCNGTQAINSANEGFPKFLVGTWKANKNLWEFTFESDGTISSFRNSHDVQIVVEEGGASTKVPGGSKMDFIIGPCQAKFTPQTDELAVTIVTDLFLLEFPKGEGVIQGSSIDKFIGKVSRKDKTWNAKWTSSDKLTDVGQASPADAIPRDLIFTKIPLK